ncbi:acetyl-CoA acetyltransferase [Bacillus obstructivus]|uniref:acetyl-CoA C-acyltransferase n=1 Tax=Heyndrickxia oleronia TaxID=38875 RepID=UPI000904531D|nr:acetyl-CoA acetyltransferase [Bacillus obstructivus]
MKKSAVIIRANRTPIGREKGIFQYLEPHQLISPLLKSLGKDIENLIDDVLLGNVVGPGGNLARFSALEAGFPLTVTGMTIDRQCSAGLDAIRTACYLIQGEAGQCYIAGGVESVSTSPFKKRAKFAPHQLGDPDMGVAAENVALKYQITREMQDEYALLSYQRSWQAYQSGMYEEEIIPIKGIYQDEEFLRKRKMDKLVKRTIPLFDKEKGTVTAANSCGIHDGASAVVLMEENLAHSLGFKPILRFVDSQLAGVHPQYPSISPVPAILDLLKRNNLTMAEIDLVEINEAFASKVLACAHQLQIPMNKLNIRGGALTLGHPYAASGAILVTRLFFEVQRKENVKFVLAAIGSAGGIGVAILFEVIT